MEKPSHTPEKYAFVGAASTGKTTLIEALKEEFYGRGDITFINESGREYFSTNPTPPELVFSVPVQTKLQEIILAKEQAAAETNPSIIFCDRSVLDSPAHLYAFGDKQGAKKLLENVEFWLPTYDLFLLLDPKDVPFEQDEIRRESEETRNMIHQAFLDFFEINNIPFQLLSGTKEERVKKVKELLNTNN